MQGYIKISTLPKHNRFGQRHGTIIFKLTLISDSHCETVSFNLTSWTCSIFDLAKLTNTETHFNLIPPSMYLINDSNSISFTKLHLNKTLGSYNLHFYALKNHKIKALISCGEYLQNLMTIFPFYCSF